VYLSTLGLRVIKQKKVYLVADKVARRRDDLLAGFGFTNQGFGNYFTEMCSGSEAGSY